MIRSVDDLIISPTTQLPPLIRRAGNRASYRFLEFFAANIRNPNTRAAYARALVSFFTWCDARGFSLERLHPVAIASYIESLAAERGLSKPTIKQHLAAIRTLFDYLVTGGVLKVNPASSVRGPKYVIRRGKTPVLSAEEARQLLDSIEADTLIGLRDRALIGVMIYTFARVSAVVGLRVDDYFPAGKRWKLRFLEKGGKYNEVYAHHKAEEYLDAYLAAAGLRGAGKLPLFRTSDRRGGVTTFPLHRTDVLRMVKRRAAAAGLASHLCNHSFRATGITAYLKNGGRVEVAQQMAGHESSRTTGLYDRRDEEISLDEVERIVI